MRVYPAIVPPPAIVREITEFSAQMSALSPNVSAQRASGPHITLKAPQYPESLEAWLPAVTAAITGAGPFQVTVGEPTFLARGILVLRTSAPGLHELNRRLATALAGFNHPGITNYDYDLYIPHITLGYSPTATSDQRAALYQQALGLLPLPAFTADELSIFIRDDQDFRYRQGPRIQLL